MSEQTKPLILIVDDTPPNIQVLADALKPLYRIKVATNGPKALSIAGEESPPDLILLDVMMPDMDGYEVCRRLQEQPHTRRIPVIFVTARSDVEDEARGFDIGAVDYITKPFHVAIVKARVRTHLSLKHKSDLLERLAAVDGLTHLPNRRRFDEVLQEEWRRAGREAHPLSLLMIDIDRFKEYNDHYGHGAGDECLRRVAAALGKGMQRAGDLMARYGGEEFAAILPDTGLEGAGKVAGELLAQVAELALSHAFSSAADHVSVSIGYAACPEPGPGEAAALLAEADRMLYQAKRAGRARSQGILWKLEK